MIYEIKILHIFWINLKFKTIGLPIGYISDKKSKSKIIKYGGIFSLLTLLGTVSVLYWIGDDERGQGELTDELNL